jgi:hypothetical protein
MFFSSLRDQCWMIGLRVTIHSRPYMPEMSWCSKTENRNVEVVMDGQNFMLPVSLPWLNWVKGLKGYIQLLSGISIPHKKRALSAIWKHVGLLLSSRLSITDTTPKYPTTYIPPWSTLTSKANSSSDGKGIPHLLLIPKVHYRIRNTPPLDPILKPAESSLRLTSILILSSHLRVGLTSSVISGFPLKMYAFLIFPMSARCPAHLIFLHLITITTAGEAHAI